LDSVCDLATVDWVELAVWHTTTHNEDQGRFLAPALFGSSFFGKYPAMGVTVYRRSVMA